MLNIDSLSKEFIMLVTYLGYQVFKCLFRFRMQGIILLCHLLNRYFQ